MDQCIRLMKADEGANLFVPKLVATALSEWLKARRIWNNPEDAIWDSKGKPIDADVQLDQNAEEVAPIINEWFEELKLKVEEAPIGDEYIWKFTEADYRRATRFLRPGT